MILLLFRLLGTAADDLDLVGLHRLAAVVELEGDVTDQEGPDFVAKAVCVERALCSTPWSAPSVSNADHNPRGL